MSDDKKSKSFSVSEFDQDLEEMVRGGFISLIAAYYSQMFKETGDKDVSIQLAAAFQQSLLNNARNNGDDKS